ncbi:MAG: preprotein translocase subunit TatC [Thermodesulfatator sp.]|nr:MAG: preprotein translocase subunit TatC [Thermodesulfatator sp.]
MNPEHTADSRQLLEGEEYPARKLILFLVQFRRFILELVISFFILTFIFYWYAPDILLFLQVDLDQKLAFFGVMEPVLALLKIASVLAILVLAPWVLWRIAQVMVATVGLTKAFAAILVVCGLLLFYAGASFCFFVTLPFGINFLLGYQSEIVKPVISVGKFVNFTGLFLLGFGLIFEIPLVMTILCRLGICHYSTFSRIRRYAILVIAILAAILTPTPDVINMALMGIPLYLLYETGILIARLNSRD